jgi:hypothetical protein
MSKIIGQFKNIKYDEIDSNKEFYCSNVTLSKGFTPLMVLVFQSIDDFDNNFQTLKNFLNNDSSIINEQNEKGN